MCKEIIICIRNATTITLTVDQIALSSLNRVKESPPQEENIFAYG
jgi:hypothetical protein